MGDNGTQDKGTGVGTRNMETQWVMGQGDRDKGMGTGTRGHDG